MGTYAESENYLNEVERFVNRKFFYRKEILTLFELAYSGSRQSTFDEIIFYAKFLTKAHTVLQRQGVSSDETQKLSEEYKVTLIKTTALIRSLIEHADEDVFQLFEQQFFLLSHAAMEKFLAFLNELNWLKNYAVDKGT